MKVEQHPFEPFIPADARVLFLGTFPPQPKRWSVKFYYPNWLNDFWRIMGLIFFNDKDRFCNLPEKSFDMEAIIAFLEEQGIALSDTAREVVRLKDNASDKFLEIVTPLDLDYFTERCPNLHTIVTTGEKAASVIASLTGTEAPSMGGFTDIVYNGGKFRHYRMPSTSRAYPLSLSAKADFYRRIFE